MSSESNIGHIIFNQMSENKYSSLIPTEGEFYVTPDYIDLPILTSMWFDHIVNDISWLRADTFSWQSGDVYTAVYNHLVNDWQTGTIQTENVAGRTFSVMVAKDGHKLFSTNSTGEQLTTDLFNETGVAWYYILDTTNHRFKLPRTKFGFTGLRNNVGNYVAPGLPNITGRFGCSIPDYHANYAQGAFTAASISTSDPNCRSGTKATGTIYGYDFYASRSSSIYGASSTVQPPATQMYLYFYVGNFNQDSIIQTAGLNAELFNGKADINVTNALQTSKLNKDLSNLPSNIKYVKETWQSGTSWYRVWSDGWIEQGNRGTFSSQAEEEKTLLKPFSNTNYNLILTNLGHQHNIYGYPKTTSTFLMGMATPGVSWGSGNFSWYACGY